MSDAVGTKLPPSLQGSLGNGDDVTLGHGSYEGMYAKHQGDLGGIQNEGGSVVGALNVLSDPHASVEAVAGAIGALTSAILVVGAQLTTEGVLLGSAALASAVPIVGWMVLAFLAVVLVMYEILPHASASAPKEDSPQEVFESAVAAVPPNLPVPVGAAAPTLDGLRIMSLLANILDREARGIPTPELHNALAAAFGNRAGFATDVYTTVADIVQSPRWAMGTPSPWLLWDTQQTQPRPDGSPGFDLGSTFAEALRAFTDDGGTIPHYLPYEAHRGADGRTYPIAGAGAPGPLDVSRYLVIFSVLYHQKSPGQARAATYAAVYQILIQKAWMYSSAGLLVPNAIYASMGFLLDQASRFPLLRLEQSQLTVQQALANGGAPNTVTFHDLSWYVRYYLAQDPRFAPHTPGVFTPSTGMHGGGAQQLPPPAPPQAPAVPVVLTQPVGTGGFSTSPVFRRS